MTVQRKENDPGSSLRNHRFASRHGAAHTSGQNTRFNRPSQSPPSQSFCFRIAPNLSITLGQRLKLPLPEIGGDMVLFIHGIHIELNDVGLQAAK